MKNIYQAILDEAREKRRQFHERGWVPSDQLVERVREYRRNREAQQAKELLDGRGKR